jgi:hypothetical protein
MTRLVPKQVNDEIQRKAYAEADSFGYLHAGMTEHARFYERLRVDPLVGGRLREFMPDGEVKQYIRHTIMNKYAKERRVPLRDVGEILARLYGEPGGEIEYNATDKVSLHRLSDGGLVVVGRILDKAWDKGLGRLLLYVARAPGLPPADGGRFEQVLILLQYGVPRNGADRGLIEEALKLVQVRAVWQ